VTREAATGVVGRWVAATGSVMGWLVARPCRQIPGVAVLLALLSGGILLHELRQHPFAHCVRRACGGQHQLSGYGGDDAIHGARHHVFL
jgi:hypothetical protein